MNVKPNENEILTGFILDYSDRALSKAEERSFTELMAFSPEIRKKAVCNWFIRSSLQHIKKVKAKAGFDQRMAAAFAMELEKETKELNLKNSAKESFISN